MAYENLTPSPVTSDDEDEEHFSDSDDGGNRALYFHNARKLAPGLVLSNVKDKREDILNQEIRNRNRRAHTTNADATRAKVCKAKGSRSKAGKTRWTNLLRTKRSRTPRRIFYGNYESMTEDSATGSQTSKDDTIDDNDAFGQGTNKDGAAVQRLAKIEALTVNKTLYQELDAAKLRAASRPAGTFKECYCWYRFPELITPETDTSLDDPEAPLIVYPVHRSMSRPCFAFVRLRKRWMSLYSGSKEHLRNSATMMAAVRRLRGVMTIPTFIPLKGAIFFRAICSRYTGRGLYARSMKKDKYGQWKDTSGVNIENCQLFIERHLQWCRRHLSPFMSVTDSIKKLLAVIEALERPKKGLPRATCIQVIAFDASGLELINPTNMFGKLRPNGIRKEWTTKEWLKAFSIPEERVLERTDILDTPEDVIKKALQENTKMLRKGLTRRKLTRKQIRREDLENQLEKVGTSEKCRMLKASTQNQVASKTDSGSEDGELAAGGQAIST